MAALPQANLAALEGFRDASCPELPLVWLVAEIQAESSWNPRAYSSAGAAGLLPLMPGTWAGAGDGVGWDVASGPADDHAVWNPAKRFAAAVPWMCRNLEEMTAHLVASGKATSPLDALAVCHIAGCSRVTGSASGIPAVGEAGCGADCVSQVRSYVDAIHHWVEEYTLPAQVVTAGAAQPFIGSAAGCTVSTRRGPAGA